MGAQARRGDEVDGADVITTDKRILAAEARLTAARKKSQTASERSRKAYDALREAEHNVRDARIGKVRPGLRAMSVVALREHVADLARNHGARCARDGRVEESEWGPFRVALAELARRAGAK